MQASESKHYGLHLPPVVIFLAAIALAILLHRYLPVRALIHYPWTLSGIPLLAAGLVLAFLAIAAFIRHRTTIHPLRVSSALVTGGVFALTRNPMYLAMLLTLAGLSLYLGSLSPWLLPLGMLPLLHCCYIRSEEAMLAETFGTEYEEYRKRVRRWI